MYCLISRRWYNTPRDFVVLKQGSLVEMVRAREVSGDLVARSDGKLVCSTAWLWPWEKANPECYAQKAIRWEAS